MLFINLLKLLKSFGYAFKGLKTAVLTEQNIRIHLIAIIVILVIAVTVTGASVLWRTCIYTRGAIFRFIGRALDSWVDKGCSTSATFWHKVLRFIAYPLGYLTHYGNPR